MRENKHWFHPDLLDPSGTDWFTTVSEIKEATHIFRRTERNHVTSGKRGNFGWEFTRAASCVLSCKCFYIWSEGGGKKSVLSDCLRLLLNWLHLKRSDEWASPMETHIFQLREVIKTHFSHSSTDASCSSGSILLLHSWHRNPNDCCFVLCCSSFFLPNEPCV